jgi:hypothetical protein
VYLAEFRRRGARTRCKFSRRRDDARPYETATAALVGRIDLAYWLADRDDAGGRAALTRIDVIPANRPAPIPE